MTTNELLRRYVEDRSESAFTDLVRGNIDLVYSAALRQVNGNIAAAQDVTQAVFTALARKARALMAHPSLTAWLYSCARFEAAKFRRSESRRQARETQAHAMSQVLQSSDSETVWQDIRPALDDVMHRLNDADREAILLRYFERQPLAQIAARFQISDNAARMRVERALDKLRVELSKRGVTSAAALALVLTERAVTAAPAGLAGPVTRAALAGAVEFGAVFSRVLSHRILWAVAVAIIAAAAFFVLPHAQPVSDLSASHLGRGASSSSDAAPQSAHIAPTLSPSSGNDGNNHLALRIITADTGQPIPSVRLAFLLFLNGKLQPQDPLYADRFGHCEVPLPHAGISDLTLVAQREGFALTRLCWHVDRGDVIPTSYTLRLERAVRLSGVVLDENGNPLAGAQVGFSSLVTDPAEELKIQTTVFSQPFSVRAVSDGTGHWEINQVGAQAVPFLVGFADEPNHLPVHFEVQASGAAPPLLAGHHVIRLARGVEVFGDVTNGAGKPVPEATVSVGYADTSHREAKTKGNGQFRLEGCAPEKTFLSATARGFAASTIPADLTSRQGPFHLVLREGKRLRIRVIDNQGRPVPGVVVHYQNRGQFDPSYPSRLEVQTEFNQSTDTNGLVEWTNAPEADLHFQVLAGDQHSDVVFRPDGSEHTISVAPLWAGLTISGSVTDAATGQPIPDFRILAGWPMTNRLSGEIGALWNPNERFWLRFHGGEYSNHFAQTPVANSSFVFKFEADGYAPFVSQPVAADAGSVRIDAALSRAASTTVTVLRPDGQPAAHASVGLVTFGSRFRLSGAQLAAFGTQLLQSTDDLGRISLAPDPAIKGIIVAHAAGFARVDGAALSNNASISLEPWSSVIGVLLYNGKPAAGRELTLSLPPQNRDRVLFLNTVVITDDSGSFSFPQALPAASYLMLAVPGRSPAGGSFHRALTNLDLAAGQSVDITVETDSPPAPVPEP